jgi:quercetin 2,3-dioxygenase
VNVISGEWGGRRGPVESLTGVFMATVELAAGGRVSFDGLAGRNVFLYVVRGRIRIGADEAPEHVLAELSDGDAVEIEGVERSVLLFGHGEPIDEPMVAHGPFVMNTADEIRQAIVDYQAGKF